MKPLLFVWFLFMASASFWLPGYKGDTAGEGATFAALYAVVGILAGIGVRGRVQWARDALRSALPAVALLAAAAVTGYLLNEQRAEDPGAPIFLYFGVALWASWAALVPSTALLSRTRWNSLMGIGVGFLVAALGFIQFTARIN